MSTKLPSFQFYPGDWMKDVALQGCSVAARGVWIQMLCMLHESSKRGYLQHENGKPVAVKKIARIVGCTVCETTRLLNELEEAGVFSRTEDGVIYSRRVIRDEEKRETLRKNGEAGGSHGDKGGRPKRTPNETPDQTPRQSKQKPQDKPLAEPQNNPSSSSVSSSTSTSEVKPLSPVATDDGEGDTTKDQPKTAKESKPKTPRQPNPLFDAIVEVTGASPKANGGHIGKVAATLASEDPPYTPDEVREFGANFLKLCTYAIDEGRTKPGIGELGNHIYKIRLKKEPTSNVGTNSRSVGGHRVEAEPGKYANLPNSITVDANDYRMPGTITTPAVPSGDQRGSQASTPEPGIW